MKQKRGFTLIEVLVVIVIISILGAILVPRISSARGRANDAARKSGVHNISMAILSNRVATAKYPHVQTGLGNSSCQNLLEVMMHNKLKEQAYNQFNVPKDPTNQNISLKLQGETISTTSGQYMYCELQNGFVLIALLQGNGGNAHLDSFSGSVITTETNSSDIAGLLGCPDDHNCNLFIHIM